MDNLAEKWKKLTFHGFRQEEYAKKHVSWENAARLLLEILLEGLNCGLVADTAAGKTIIALLAIYALGKRVLFLTPQRLLAEQHHDLTGKMDGDDFNSRIIHGHTGRKKRIWNDPADRIVFATPHVVMEDIRKGLFGFQDFQIVVFDEMHRATGDYPYVPLAKLVNENGLQIFGLTASPGWKLEKVGPVRNNLFLNKFFEVNVETPKKIEDIVLAETDDNLKEIENIFRRLLLELAREISAMGIEMDQEELTHMRIFQSIEKELKIKHKYRGAYLAAKYRKLYHAYFITLTESYGTVLEYLGRMKREDGSVAAREIVLDKRVWQLATIAKNNCHPKVERFFEILATLKNRQKNALIFFSQKTTARALAELLKEKGWRIELLFGSRDKNIKHQKVVLQKIADREIDFVFATSVAEEGLSVPEIDTVIHYSMPPTEISLIQRSGRTGRMKKGHVIFLTINHPLDRIFYFAAKAKVKKMRQLIKDGLLERETMPIPRRKSKKQEDYLTLPLFKSPTEPS